MNVYQAEELFRKLYPGKNVSLEFDSNCHRKHELIYTNDIPNEMHHIENDKVKINVEGMDPIYVDILPHREVATWDYMRGLILNADSRMQQKRAFDAASKVEESK